MSTPDRSGPVLAATYFDGKSAKAHTVQLQCRAGTLHITGEAFTRSVRLTDVQWPERTRHGKRVAHFADGGQVQTDDAAAWHTWQSAHGRQDSWVVRMQQSWRTVLASALLLLALLAAGYRWGLPLLADAVVAATPRAVDTSLGESALAAIDSKLMRPSQLGAAQQRRIQAAWQQAVAALPAGQAPQFTLLFRQSRIGPNAFALPGGAIILTDELVKLVDADTQVLTAVLAHELGHLAHRDGLRLLVEVTVLGSISSALLGDFSSLLAAVPALLGQAHYSHQAEHQADVYSVYVLKAAHLPASAMVTLFDRLAQKRKPKPGEEPTDSLLGIAFASHPPNAERIAFFREATP